MIGDFASGLACPTPLFALSASLCTPALATGHGAEDTAAVCAVYEEMAGWSASDVIRPERVRGWVKRQR